MALTLQPRGPSGEPAQWHAVWSVNLSTELGQAVNPRDLATRVLGAFTTWRLRALAPPVGHVCPEVVLQPLGAGLGRTVLTIEAWFTVPGAIDTDALNGAIATAIRQAGAGEDFPEHEVGAAMATCGTVARPWSWIPGLGADVSAVCATYTTYLGEPRSTVTMGAVARAVAGPIADSNNTARVGEEPPPVVPPDTLTVWHKVAIGAGVFLVAAAILGYTVRSFRGAVG